MTKCFFTIVDDKYFYPAGTPQMINSFKVFHPDIDLVVFRQDMIDKVFKEKNINFYMAKPTFAKLLTPYYDLVVNVDCDSVFLGRCDSILAADYEVGSVINFNDYENASFDNIKPEMYLQAGLVASTNKRFWDIWEEANKEAMRYIRQENDIFNLVVYNNPEVQKMKLKIFDKDKDYYGCKSLNREGEFYLEDGKVMCRKEQVYLYHNAKGRKMPKLVYENMGFKPEVVAFCNAVSYYGHTLRLSSI